MRQGNAADIQIKSARGHWVWPNRNTDLFSGVAPPLLRDGVGVFEIGDLPEQDAVPANYGGNVQLGGITADVPLGRVVVGKQMAKRYQDFFLLQEVQAPLASLDLNWLFIKHVDEVCYFLPRGAVAVASPEFGEKLIRQHLQEGADPAELLFLKGTIAARGTLTSVEQHGQELWLPRPEVESSPVHPDMYLHIYAGPGRYQTYAIVAVERTRIKVRQDEAAILSFWRTSNLELPAAGSQYVIFDQPLHNRQSQVLTLTLSELLDTSNARIRRFWAENAKAADAIRNNVIPQLQSLGVTRLVELPVLFYEVSSEQFGSGSTAFTPNLVNGHLLGKTFVMPKPFVMKRRHAGGAIDLFEAAAASALGELGVEFVDDYFLFHNAYGEVHCAVNVMREAPLSGPYWWQRR
jgi:hypothetical protein